MNPKTSPVVVDPYPRALQWMGLGVLLVVTAVGIALYQLGRSNRPHELTMVPLVAGLAIVNAVVCFAHGRNLRRAWQGRREGRSPGWRYLLFPLGIGYMALSGTVLVISLGTLIEYLGAR